MEKRIELEKRGRPENQVTELILDNCRSPNIVGLTDGFSKLQSLSLIAVGLTTLRGFPNLPNLKKLELSDNRISNGLNYLSGSVQLQELGLSGNKIKDVDTLKPLETFKKLEILDLFNNDVTTLNDYREKIFAMIPSLKYLDGFDSQGLEVPSDTDEENLNGNESDDDGSDADDNSDDYPEGEEGDEEEDISLAEVYNDDIEDDLSDYNEEDDENDDEDEEEDEESNDGDANESAEVPATGAAADEAEEESPARGKKRKHDG